MPLTPAQQANLLVHYLHDASVRGVDVTQGPQVAADLIQVLLQSRAAQLTIINNFVNRELTIATTLQTNLTTSQQQESTAVNQAVTDLTTLSTAVGGLP